MAEAGPDQRQITPEELPNRVAAAGGHLLLEDLTPDELKAWRHAARTAQLRLLRAGTVRLSKWTSGNSLRISVSNPTAPPKTPRQTSSPKPTPKSQDHGDFVGREIRVSSKLPKVPHALIVEMQDGMARRDADRWRPHHSRAVACSDLASNPG
jgi:hypothetical protein